MVAVFLLPATLAISTEVNGTAWNLQDLTTCASQLLAPAVAIFTPASAVPVAVVLLADVTHHPVTHVPLFELECALIR